MRSNRKRSPEYYMDKCGSVSSSLGTVVRVMFSKLDWKTPPETLYNSCDALLRLQRTTDPVLFELACNSAIRMGRCHYKFIENAIKSKCLGILEASRIDDIAAPPEHGNIRGAFN